MKVNAKNMAEDTPLGFCSIKGPKQEQVTDRKRGRKGESLWGNTIVR